MKNLTALFTMIFSVMFLTGCFNKFERSVSDVGTGDSKNCAGGLPCDTTTTTITSTTTSTTISEPDSQYGEWQPETLIVGPEDAMFGKSIVSKNGLVIIGAPQEGDGAVYVYQVDGTTLNQVQKLTQTSPIGDDEAFSSPHFGYSLAYNGEYLAVGMPGADAKRSPVHFYDSGVVHIYKLMDGLFVHMQKLDTSNRGAAYAVNGEFGRVVRFYNNTLIATSPGEGYDITNQGSGLVRIYNLQDGQFTLHKYITDSTSEFDSIGKKLVIVDGQIITKGFLSQLRNFDINNILSSTDDLIEFGEGKIVFQEEPNVGTDVIKGFGDGLFVYGYKLSEEGRPAPYPPGQYFTSAYQHYSLDGSNFVEQLGEQPDHFKTEYYNATSFGDYTYAVSRPKGDNSDLDVDEVLIDTYVGTELRGSRVVELEKWVSPVSYLFVEFVAVEGLLVMKEGNRLNIGLR